jgi:hypothetical protein
VPSLSSFLSRLESRLQSLVEDSVAWFFPSSRISQDLSRRLADAMRRSVRPPRFAPDIYLVALPPAQARALQTDPTMLDALARGLEQAAQAEGLAFAASPVVRIVPDPAARTPRITTRFGDGQGEHTGTLEIFPVPSPSQDPAPSIGIPSGAFLIVDGGEIFPLDHPVISIGRGPENALVLDEPRISRQHAQLRLIDNRYVIFDLDSTGGTLVNGQPVHRQALAVGDVISLAGLTLVYGQDGSPTAADQTQELNAA